MLVLSSLCPALLLLAAAAGGLAVGCVVLRGRASRQLRETPPEGEVNHFFLLIGFRSVPHEFWTWAIPCCEDDIHDCDEI